MNFRQLLNNSLYNTIYDTNHFYQCLFFLPAVEVFLPAVEVAVVVINDLASLSLKDAVPGNTSVEPAALDALTTGPEIRTHIKESTSLRLHEEETQTPKCTQERPQNIMYYIIMY